MQKVLVFLALSLMAFPAFAQKKAPAKAATQQNQEEGRQGPAALKISDRDMRQSQMNSLAQAKRQEAIERLSTLMENFSGMQKADLTFRLAELYWESQKYFYFQAMQNYNEAYKAWFDAGASGPQPVIDESQSKTYKDKALALYQEILDNYEGYERTDEVLYVMAFNLYESGNQEKALAMYKSLIERFPQSKNVADAYLQIGDHYFNNNQLDPAKEAYEQALKTNKPKIYSYAVYKLAWCDFNYKDYASSLTKMKKVVEYSDTQKGNENVEGGIAENDRIQLREEALSDMTMIYSRLDEYKEAISYYQSKVDGDTTQRFISKLAALFNDQGKWNLELSTLKDINDIYPNHPKAPENQSNIVRAYAQLEQPDNVRKEVRRLIDLYRPQSPWAVANKDNQIAIAAAYELTEEALRNLVEEYHRDAQKFKNVATYQLARDLYAEYLDYFYEAESAYRMRFLYAEILYALKEFAAAAPQYDKVVEQDAAGEFAKLAAYNAILSYEKVVEGAKEEASGRIDEKAKKGNMRKVEKVDKLEKGKKYEVIELTAAEQSLANAYDRFVKVAPDDEEVVKVKYKSARIYYVANQFDAASTRFGEIIDNWPKDPLARLGAEHILESYNIREEWSSLRVWAEKFAENKVLMADSKFAKTVNTMLEGAAFKEIQTVIEPRGDALATAEAYQKYVSRFSKGSFAIIALYNSIIYYDKAQKLDRAIVESNKLLKDFNNFSTKDNEAAQAVSPTQIRRMTLFGLAKLYERVAMFPEAAEQYELFFKNYKEAEEAADAIYNAALFRQGLGELKAAIADYNNYLTTAASAQDAAQIYWRIGTLYSKNKEWAKAAAHFDGYEAKFRNKVSPARILYSRLKMAEALEENGQAGKNTANKVYSDIVARYNRLPDNAKRDPEAVSSIARARFALTEPQYNAYKNIKLTLAQMNRQLESKMAKLSELEKEYTAILGLGDGAMAIASLYRIGAINSNFSSTLKEAPVPPNLTEDQQEIYLAALEEQTFPLDEKAIEAYEMANSKSFELGLYTEWTIKTQAALSEFDVNRFPEQRSFTLLSSEPVSNLPKAIPPDPIPYEELQPAPAENSENSGAAL